MATIKIKHGQSYKTIKDAMMGLFGKKTAGYRAKTAYWIVKDSLCVWFFEAAGVNPKNGLLRSPRGNNWIDIVDNKEKEIAEVWLQGKLRKDDAMNKTGVDRLVFIKEAGTDYHFAGVYKRGASSASGRVRLYDRIKLNFDSAAYPVT
jgi:hypothetical protein